MCAHYVHPWGGGAFCHTSPGASSAHYAIGRKQEQYKVKNLDGKPLKSFNYNSCKQTADWKSCLKEAVGLHVAHVITTDSKPQICENLSLKKNNITIKFALHLKEPPRLQMFEMHVGLQDF